MSDRSYASDNPLGVGDRQAGNVSILKIYSLGEAAANMEVGQTELYVTPKEIRPNIDGEVTDAETEFSTKGVDAKGGAYATNVVASNAIKARWLSRNAWLKSPGLIRRGEEVILWRVGDTDQYFWELMGTTNELRRKDIMIIAISNTPDEETTELTPENSVFFEINTVDKYVSLTTPDNDGEACGYSIQLNMKDGTFSIADTLENAIAIDSVKSLIHLQNASGTFIKLDKGTLDLFAPEQMNLKSPVLNIEAEETKMTGATLSTNYPTTTFGGSQLAMSFSNGSMDVGDMNVGGSSMNYTVGQLTHNGKNIGDIHTHDNVKAGSDTSGPVT